PRLADVLRGVVDPLTLLFPSGSFENVEKVYQTSPFAQVDNGLIRRAVRAALAALPSDRPVRVLEIGAGTGGSTTHILPELPAERTEYVFTDVSPLFLARARLKFRDYPFLRYELLNIERDPEAQGFGDQRFDIIIAANVIHATANLRETLGHMHSLAASGAWLLLLEVTREMVWVDLTFGLTEGWWRFTDTDLRRLSPLLPPASWTNLLTAV